MTSKSNDGALLLTFNGLGILDVQRLFDGSCTASHINLLQLLESNTNSL